MAVQFLISLCETDIPGDTTKWHASVAQDLVGAGEHREPDEAAANGRDVMTVQGELAEQAARTADPRDLKRKLSNREFCPKGESLDGAATRFRREKIVARSRLGAPAYPPTQGRRGSCVDRRI